MWESANEKALHLSLLREMAEATCSFSDENLLLGKGGFGRVYKGTLCSGEVCSNQENGAATVQRSRRGARISDGKHRFLVYEYMNEGNLQDHLNGEVKMYSVRLKVAIGAARGFAYLHSSSAVGIPIVHTKFKSTNILLDSNNEAKISDFGLAKLMPESQETCVTTRVLGTYVYFDPDYTLVRDTF